MTQPEYEQKASAGEIKDVTPAPETTTPAPQPTKADTGFTLDDFLPMLVQMLPLITHLTAAPTYVPKNYLESFAFVDDGAATYLYLYINGAWRSATLGGTSVVGRSYLSVAQGVPTTFNTKITLDVNEYADGITWDSGNSRFICVTPGKYLVSAALQWSAAQNYQHTLNLYKNGARITQGGFISGGYSGAASSNLSDIVTLSANDWLELYAIQYSGGTVNVNGDRALTYLALTKIP